MDRLDEELAAVLFLALLAVYETEARKVAAEVGVETPNLQAEAAEFARKRTLEVVRDFRAYTEKHLRQKASEAAAAAAVLATVFGPARAAGLAASEITRAANTGELAQVKAANAQAATDATPAKPGPSGAVRRITLDGTGRIARGDSDQQANVAGRTDPKTITIWETREDERVCPVCQPLNGTTYEVFGVDHPAGPPAHPNCRCYLSHRVVR